MAQTTLFGFPARAVLVVELPDGPVEVPLNAHPASAGESPDEWDMFVVDVWLARDVLSRAGVNV